MTSRRSSCAVAVRVERAAGEHEASDDATRHRVSQCGSYPEDRPHLTPEQRVGREDRQRQQHHRPHAQRAGDVQAVAEALGELVDRLGDRVVLRSAGRGSGCRSPPASRTRTPAAPPATRLARISGTVIRGSTVAATRPRFAAASSRSRGVCCSPATAERTTYGSRRAAYASTSSTTGYSCTSRNAGVRVAELPLEPDADRQVPERQHDPRHRQRQHRQRVDEPAAGHVAADDQHGRRRGRRPRAMTVAVSA